MVTSDNPKTIGVPRPDKGKIFLKLKSIHLVAVAQVIECDRAVGLEVLVETSTTFALVVVWVRPQTRLAITHDTIRDQRSGQDHECVKPILKSLSGFLVGPLLIDDGEDHRCGPTTKGVVRAGETPNRWGAIASAQSGGIARQRRNI